MAGQAAHMSVKEVKSCIDKLETNQQMRKGSDSGKETNQQVGAKMKTQKKSC